MSTRLLAVACAALFALQGCRREPETYAFTCPTTGVLYGYAGASVSPLPYVPCSAGNIDLASGAMASTAATISNNTQFNQSAYSLAEDAYFSFLRGDAAYSLYKVSGTGSTTLSYTGAAVDRMDGLVYDRMHGKLYCFVTSGSTSVLSEIVIMGTSYTTNAIVTSPEVALHDNTTADPGSGDIYFQTLNMSTQQYSIYKHVHGSTSTPTLIYVSPAATEMWGLRYNPNDDMLYALRLSLSVANTYELVMLNPSTGTLSSIANLGININPKFLSATIDPCNNRYIFAAQIITAGTASLKMYQLEMTGSVTSVMPLSQMYQGLDVRY